MDRIHPESTFMLIYGTADQFSFLRQRIPQKGQSGHAVVLERDSKETLYNNDK